MRGLLFRRAILLCGSTLLVASLTIDSAFSANDDPFTSLGFRSVGPDQSSGEPLQISLAVVPVGRCRFGDLNALGFDLARTTPNRTELLLSIEDLSNDTDTAKSFAVSLNALGPGTSRDRIEVSVRVDPVTVPTLYGVFLCTHTDGARRCVTKQADPIDDILNEYKVGSHAQSRGPAPDRVYFFRPIIVSPERISVPTHGFSEGEYRELGAALRRTGGVDQFVSTALGRVRMYSDKLGSRDLHLDGQTVELQLPFMEQARCR